MQLPIKNKLDEHQKEISLVHLKDLFHNDKNRFQNFSCQVGDILFDYSKQRITKDTIDLLCKLAEDCQLQSMREALFSGAAINNTEKRSVLHTALRDPSSEPIWVDEKNIKEDIKHSLDRMLGFVNKIHAGEIKSSTNEIFTDVICLGIGGSELGPLMVCEALNQYKNENNLKIHFISNVDGHTLDNVLKQCFPGKTLALIHSKTFTTPETMQNAHSLKSWFKTLGDEKFIQQHLVGITSNKEKAIEFGIHPDRIFEFWDWVGGRFSIWSSVGLSIALSIGTENFKDFLKGAYLIDKHFLDAPFSKNIPVLMALLSIWNINFWNCQTQAIMPYDDGLAHFPAYLQQLEMESNGKSILKNGSSCNNSSNAVSYSTAPVIWGGVGCNGQHAYMQLLHQGTEVIPVDFFIAAEGHPDYLEQHQLLVASCLSQSKALMEGCNPTENQEYLNLHRTCPGNRPSSTFMYSKLTPEVMGALIALYEHKTFVQGVIWGINSFDQWGVELGKKLVKTILPYLKNNHSTWNTDSSTMGLIEFYKKSI